MNEAPARLANESRGEHPYIRPRDAASLIIVDRDAKSPRVLMGRRSMKHVFFPGAYVFPGGRVDPGDGAVPAADEMPAHVAARLLSGIRGRPSQRRARALALTALRETFEEAGLLIGRVATPDRYPTNPDWRCFFDHGIVPALSPLAFVARAITPPGRPRRFDTRFFAVHADAVVKTLPAHERPTEELSELVWLPIEEAKALPIPSITRTVLDDLQSRLDGAGSLHADVPVPFYRMIRGRFVRELA